MPKYKTNQHQTKTKLKTIEKQITTTKQPRRNLTLPSAINKQLNSTLILLENTQKYNPVQENIKPLKAQSKKSKKQLNDRPYCKGSEFKYSPTHTERTKSNFLTSK